MKKNTCPCCGYITLNESSEYEICQLCRWEDDPSQTLHPSIGGGANEPSLIEAQVNFIKFGISNPELNEDIGDISKFIKDINWKSIEI